MTTADAHQNGVFDRPSLERHGDRPHFDVRDFARTAQGSHRAEIDADAFVRSPLADDVLVAVRVLRDTERATMTHMRDVLVTPTHKEARVTAFLTTWAFEKYWIADALDTVLRAHDSVPAATEPEQGLGARFGALRERLRPIRIAFVTNLIGEDVVAAHLALGTVDEWTTRALFRRLAERAAHPELTKLVDTVLAVKQRHLGFLEAEARWRLGRSGLARRLADAELRGTALPIGSDDVTRADRAAAFDTLVSPGDPAVLAALVDTLPGQHGSRVVARSLAGRGDGPGTVALGTALGRGVADAVATVRRTIGRSGR